MKSKNYAEHIVKRNAERKRVKDYYSDEAKAGRMARRLLAKIEKKTKNINKKYAKVPSIKRINELKLQAGFVV